MALPGECVNDTVVTCCCGLTLKIYAYKSAAGWYIGFFCPKCGPYSRESEYYATSDEALANLKAGTYGR